MGCGKEIAPGTSRTPGWKIKNKDKIEKDTRGFNKISIDETIINYYKPHCTVYKLGVQTVTSVYCFMKVIQHIQMQKK